MRRRECARLSEGSYPYGAIANVIRKGKKTASCVETKLHYHASNNGKERLNKHLKKLIGKHNKKWATVFSHGLGGNLF